MVQSKEPGARVIAKLHNDMDSLLTVVLIGINFISTLASSVGTALAIQIAGSNGVGISTAVITFFITIFGEIVPKTAATVNPVKTARHNAPILLFLEKVCFPVVWLFSAISHGVSELAQKVWKQDSVLITEEELKALIDVGTREGTLEGSEQTMLYRLFEFSDLHVHDIIKHRSYIKAISLQTPKDAIVQAFLDSGYSRLPVYEGTVEKIVGILHYKAVLFAGQKESEQPHFISKVMQSVLYVPESFSALELLRTFKKERNDMAIALDEQGSVAGLVTMDDVLQAVFGRMHDEFSDNEVAPENRIQILSGSEFIVPGDMKLSDINDILHLHLDSEEYLTIAGWLLERFDALPSTGEAIKYDNTIFVVEDQTRHRIVSVRIKK